MKSDLCLKSFLIGDEPILGLALSPSGDKMAVKLQRHVKLVDLETGSIINEKIVDYGNKVLLIDEDIFVVADRYVLLVGRFEEYNSIRSCKVSCTYNVFFSQKRYASFDDYWRKIRIGDFESGKISHALKVETRQEMQCGTFDVTGENFVLVAENIIQKWDVESAQTVKIVQRPESMAKEFAVECVVDSNGLLYVLLEEHSDDDVLAKFFWIEVWNLETGKIVNTVDNGYEDSRRVSSIMVDAGRLYLGLRDGSIEIVCGLSGQVIERLLGHDDQVLSLALRGDKLYSSSFDGVVKIWDVSKFKE